MTFLAGFLDNAAVLGPVLEEQFLEAVRYDQRSFRSEWQRPEAYNSMAPVLLCTTPSG